MAAAEYVRAPDRKVLGLNPTGGVFPTCTNAFPEFAKKKTRALRALTKIRKIYAPFRAPGPSAAPAGRGTRLAARPTGREAIYTIPIFSENQK